MFAAYAAYTDYEIGRVVQEVQDEGKLDNTLIIYICGDNGTSAEGTLEGTFNDLTAYNGIFDVPMPLQLLHYREWGSDKTFCTCPSMARGRSTLRSSGPSRWHRISEALGRDWPFHWSKGCARCRLLKISRVRRLDHKPFTPRIGSAEA